MTWNLQKAFDIIEIIWYLGIIIFCISSFLGLVIGTKYGRQSELFDFVLSLNYLILVAKSKFL